MQKFHLALLMLPTVNNHSVDVNFWTRYHGWIHSFGLGPPVFSVSKTPGLRCNFFKVQSSTLCCGSLFHSPTWKKLCLGYLTVLEI